MLVALLFMVSFNVSADSKFNVNTDRKINSTDEIKTNNTDGIAQEVHSEAVVHKVDLDANILVINSIEYQMKRGAITLTENGQFIRFEDLKEGSTVNFVLENDEVISVELVEGIDDYQS